MKLKKMLNLRIPLFIVAMMIVFPGFKSLASDIWMPGLIELNSGQKISGDIKFHIEENLIVVRDAATLKAFSPVKVNYFKILDQDRGAFRTFYAIPSRNTHGKYYTRFYEILYLGKLTLLNRDRIERMTEYMHQPFDFNGPVPVMEYSIKVDDLYIADSQGNIYPLESIGQSKFLELMSDHRKQMEAYFQNRDPDLKNRIDIINLLAYYNGLR
jgi:hypothetical protein